MRSLILVFTLLFSFSVWADSVTLYVMAPLGRINWKSPRTLSWSIIKGEYQRRRGGTHQVGHGMIEVRCEPQNSHERPIQILTAMTTDDGVDEKVQLMKEKIGLALFFTTNPGRLEEFDEIAKTLTDGTNSGRVRFINFKISHANCLRTARYHKEFVERKYDKNYGYPNLPRHGKASACTDYAYSYLEVAGVMTSEMDRAWTYIVPIPERLVGGSLTNRRVGLMKLLTDGANSWITDGGPYFFYKLHDTQFAYDWITQVRTTAGNGRYADYKKVQIANSIGLSVDRSSAPDETSPIWLQ